MNKDSIDKLENTSLDDVYSQLKTSSDGISSSEAQSRIGQYGYNELPEKKENPILTFLSYFWGPIPWMIEIAAILSAILQHWTDFGLICFLLAANALVGFWEEFQAGNEVSALKAKLALKARAKRDGNWQEVEARTLVPGDIIRLRMGDIVPADAKLLEGDPISVDQSTLTGESLPVDKASGKVIFSGSIVKKGEAEAVITSTGVNTFFGKTAQLVAEARTESHYQKAVMKVGDYLILIAVGLAVVVFFVSLFRHEPVLDTLQFLLVLIVGGIPAAMPTVLSVTMAIGARCLAKESAIVTKLSSVEEMAGIDVLCSDKTGTLTMNQLALGDIALIESADEESVVLAGALASREEDQDAIDLAVIAGLKDKDSVKGYQVEHWTPFDPVHKRTEAEIKGPDGSDFKVTKGAAQVILDLVADKDKIADKVQNAVDGFAARGFKSLGVARADNGGWKFLGVLSLSDPPRPDSKDMLAKAAELGVRAKMVTGDQVAIAKETAHNLGLGTNILDASILDTEKDQTKLIAEIEAADGFAQVFPQHKFTIVSSLQQGEHITGMTGDGVNDAPALKKADAGIAVSGATDAARAAAALVLMKSGLSVIVDAIEESRKTFNRMNAYTIYRIAETIGLLFFITLSILVFNLFPVTTIQIIILTILNDGGILGIAFDNTTPSKKPERWNMPRVLLVSTMLGIFRLCVSFSLLWMAINVFDLDVRHLQTFIYLNLSIGGHWTIFASRTRGPWWSIAPSGIFLALVMGTNVIATLISVYGIFMPNINWALAGFIWGFTFGSFLIQDMIKLKVYKYLVPEISILASGRRAPKAA
ncbi:plasma-membrane proton-efflux P-type ATPase [bacterium]|nr:plasma-membrane proton-efflux P-type ATPase [bacterium]